LLSICFFSLLFSRGEEGEGIKGRVGGGIEVGPVWRRRIDGDAKIGREPDGLIEVGEREKAVWRDRSIYCTVYSVQRERKNKSSGPPTLNSISPPFCEATGYTAVFTYI
jgi:hypothetical protein